MGSQPLVDAHVHLYPDPAAGVRAKDRYVIWEYGDDPGVAFSASPGDLSTLTSVYAKAGFDHAVVVHLFDTALAREQLEEHLGAPEAAEAAADVLRAANRWIARAVADHPMAEVLISIDPTVLPPQAITAHLAELAAAGVRGVKLHPVVHSFIPNDARLHPMYELCAEAGLTVLSHSGRARGGLPAGGLRPVRDHRVDGRRARALRRGPVRPDQAGRRRPGDARLGLPVVRPGAHGRPGGRAA